jgi:hypothetical protein
MNLRRLLEVESRLLTEQQEKAMRFAESAWMKAGSPTERRPLIVLLENTMKGCIENGHEYPPVLLKRKKQLERGDWAPRQVARTNSHSNPAFHQAIDPDWVRQANEDAWRKGK